MMWINKPPLGVKPNWADPINKGLVLCLLFNENGGGVVYDLSGYGNDGDLTNMAFPPTPSSGWNPGKDGPALMFDGTDDIVPATVSLSFDIAATISFSLKFPIVTEHRGLFDWGDAADGIYIHYTNDGDIKLYFIPNGWANGFVSVDVTDVDNFLTWSHWAITLDGSSIRLHKHGVLQAGPQVYTSTAKTLSKTGGYVGVATFLGLIDDVRIWNRALTPREIQRLSIAPYSMFEWPRIEQWVVPIAVRIPRHPAVAFQDPAIF